MSPLDSEGRLSLLGWIPFITSAALVAYALHLTTLEPWLGLATLVVAALFVIPGLLQRRRLRRLLRSGDVETVLGLWEDSLTDVPHRETMAPLIRATALAAHGFCGRARDALLVARRGPAWDAAIEHRLLVDTLLEVLDGDRDLAVESARVLSKLPLPPSPILRRRVTALRGAVGAFARAFAHQTEHEDARRLEAAAQANPLVHWAMRYAAAVAHIDRGKPALAAELLVGAPEWPAASVFREFHAEITAQLDPGAAAAQGN